jgi:DnaJ-class molecular chaperone
MSRDSIIGWRVKPHRPYKNFGLFCLAHGSSLGNPYPCLVCGGQGTVYDPTDPPCPVEGSKYRQPIRCAACGGSGKGTKEACRQAYQKTVDVYRREKAVYDEFARLRRQALKKLTKEEIFVLRELGL